MQIIVVSGKTFSGDDSLAEALAKRLGYRFVDASVVIERAAAYGLSHDDLNQALRRPPRARDRFLRKRQGLLLALRSALTEEIGRGEAVCCGNLGELLVGAPDCLRIEIETPLQVRTVRIRDRLKLSREEARDLIRNDDRNREKWLRDVCGPNTVGNADLVLDLGLLTATDACELAALFVLGSPTSVRSGASTMEDFALSCRVRAALAIHPETAGIEVDTAAEAGVVRLSGWIRLPEQLREVQRVAWSVPAVAGVVLNGEAMERTVAPDGPVCVSTRRTSWGSPRWHALRPVWVQMGLIIVLTIAGSWSLSELGSRMTANLASLNDDTGTFIGTITDTICGPKPMDAQCVRTCVRSGAGARYALYDGQRLYNLTEHDEQGLVARYAAQRVKIRGNLDGTAGSLKVVAIQPIS